MGKKKRSFTLSDNADLLLIALAAKLGISKTAVLEIAVRAKAEQERVSLPNAEPPPHNDVAELSAP